MSINKIGMNNSPYEFTKIYKGQYNGIRYLLTFNKLYEDEYGETEYSTEISWIDYIDEDRAKVVNEAIIKLFKSKIDQKLILKD